MARADDPRAEVPLAFATERTVHHLACLNRERAVRMTGMRGFLHIDTAGPWRDAGQFRRYRPAVADGPVLGEMFLPMSVAVPEGMMTVKAPLVVYRGGSGFWRRLQRVRRQP